MRYAVVQGCSKGLGLSFARLLLARTSLHVVGLTHAGKDRAKHNILEASLQSAAAGETGGQERLVTLDCDVTHDEDVQRAASDVQSMWGTGLGLLVNFAGTLHAEKNIASLEYDPMRRQFEVNTFGHALMFKHFLPLVPRKAGGSQDNHDGKELGLVGQGTAVLASVTARVGSIADNERGGWYSYRASKAAANQMVRTLAHELELRKTSAVAFAYQPGTMKTELGGHYAAGRNGEGVFQPDEAAEKLFDVVASLKQEENGTFLDWRHQQLPW